MIRNRSVPESPVIPVLAYADAGEAAAWLRDALGFRVRLRIADHRVQLHAPGGGAVIVTTGVGRAESESSAPRVPFATHSVHVRVEDLDRVFAKAVAHGAGVVAAPADHPYGERQASVDPGGHRWTLSRSIADADPADWGGEMVEPD